MPPKPAHARAATHHAACMLEQECSSRYTSTKLPRSSHLKPLIKREKPLTKLPRSSHPRPFTKHQKPLTKLPRSSHPKPLIKRQKPLTKLPRSSHHRPFTKRPNPLIKLPRSSHPKPLIKRQKPSTKLPRSRHPRAAYMLEQQACQLTLAAARAQGARTLNTADGKGVGAAKETFGSAVGDCAA